MWIFVNVLFMSLKFKLGGKLFVALIARNLVLYKSSIAGESIHGKTEHFLFLLQHSSLQDCVVFVNLLHSLEDPSVRGEKPGADLALMDSIFLEAGNRPKFRN